MTGAPAGTGSKRTAAPVGAADPYVATRLGALMASVAVPDAERLAMRPPVRPATGWTGGVAVLALEGISVLVTGVDEVAGTELRLGVERQGGARAVVTSLSALGGGAWVSLSSNEALRAPRATRLVVWRTADEKTGRPGEVVLAAELPPVPRP